MTEPTPIIMPNMVRVLRNLFAANARMAIRIDSKTFMLASQRLVLISVGHRFQRDIVVLAPNVKGTMHLSRWKR